MVSYRFNVPLYLTRGKSKPKNYWLNMNGYRNWKYHLNNDLKKQFKEEIELPDLDNTIQSEVKVVFTFYYPDNRLRDIDGSLSVISKFTLDALVEDGILEDDNYKYVVEVKGKLGGVDKANPRCEVEIKEK